MMDTIPILQMRFCRLVFIRRLMFRMKNKCKCFTGYLFDSYEHAVVPFLGGIAIRDLNAEETETLGYFSPKQHDGSDYVIQSSYTFLDAENRIVCPTSNNHVLILQATDEEGNVLPEFKSFLILI